MNTPAHLIIGAAAFSRPNAWAINLAALLGAFAPDASLYFLVAWHRFVRDTPFQVIFDQLYFSPAWQAVFAVDNSFFVWGGLLALGFAFRSAVLKVFSGAGLLHIALDFPLHHDDGRPHFWPLSDWVFESPISYWDSRAYGEYVSVLEVGLCVLLLLVLWRRFSGRITRGLILLALMLQILPSLAFALLL